MAESYETIDTAASLPLPAELTIGAARALQALLLEASRRPGLLALDGSAVGTVDTAGLQLLVACRRDVRLHGGDVEVRDASATLVAAAETLGLSEPLGLSTPTARGAARA